MSCGFYLIILRSLQLTDLVVDLDPTIDFTAGTVAGAPSKQIFIHLFDANGIAHSRYRRNSRSSAIRYRCVLSDIDEDTIQCCGLLFE